MSTVRMHLVLVSILASALFRSGPVEGAEQAAEAPVRIADLTALVNAAYAAGERGQSFDLSDDWSAEFDYQNHSSGEVLPLTGEYTHGGNANLVGWCCTAGTYTMPMICANISGQAQAVYQDEVAADEVYMTPGFGQNSRIAFTSHQKIAGPLELKVYGHDLENGGSANTVEVFLNGTSLGSFDIANMSENIGSVALPGLAEGAKIEVLVTTKGNPTGASSNNIGLHVELFRWSGDSRAKSVSLTALVNERSAAGELGHTFLLSGVWSAQFAYQDNLSGNVLPMTGWYAHATYANLVGWCYRDGKYQMPNICANISGQKQAVYQDELAPDEIYMCPGFGQNPRIVFTTQRALRGTYRLRVCGHDLEDNGPSVDVTVFLGGKELGKFEVLDRGTAEAGAEGEWILSNLPRGAKIEVLVNTHNNSGTADSNETGVKVELYDMTPPGLVLMVF